VRLLLDSVHVVVSDTLTGLFVAVSDTLLPLRFAGCRCTSSWPWPSCSGPICSRSLEW
jgi:hypothetical protein